MSTFENHYTHLKHTCIAAIQRSDFETKDAVWQQLEMLIANNLYIENISADEAESLKRQLKCKLIKRFERFEKILNGEQKY